MSRPALRALAKPGLTVFYYFIMSKDDGVVAQKAGKVKWTLKGHPHAGKSIFSE
jgi:hypothetical protein